jgi:N-acetyl-gamma-glutamyl-phosphate reductase
VAVYVLPLTGAPPTPNPNELVRVELLCDLHRPQDGDVVVVLSVIDNLVKGAAGQAVQNMNVMFGLEEQAGLGGAALLP